MVNFSLLLFLLLLLLLMVMSSNSNRLPFSFSHHHHHHHPINKLLHNDTPRPKIAIITEPDACSSELRMEETFDAIQSAVSTHLINLISIRLVQEEKDTMFQQRMYRLVENISRLKTEEDEDFVLVVNNLNDDDDDDDDDEMKMMVDGIHVKECNVDDIPHIRDRWKRQFDEDEEEVVVVGTSVHSIESALHAWKHHQPDYLFVGTCYETESHPQKTTTDLEGPDLPGRVRHAILKEMKRLDGDKLRVPPVIFAIGGIDTSNCHEPVLGRFDGGGGGGADGVAVIRSVMRADDPRGVVMQMVENMRK